MVRLGFRVLIVLAALVAGAVGSAFLYGEVLQPVKALQPPVFITMDDIEAHVWEAWAGRTAYVSPGKGAIGLRSTGQVSQCIEAEANLLHEDQTLAVEAMYRIIFWEHEAIEGEQITVESDWVHSMLQLNASNRSAYPFWYGIGEYEAGPGCWSLAGDLL
ncbi:MAG: hypothetical protein ITG05_13095 [Pseudomonas stutzeri]|nr:hypothetical protein [Stutzerimonas stutzeri]